MIQENPIFYKSNLFGENVLSRLDEMSAEQIRKLEHELIDTRDTLMTIQARAPELNQLSRRNWAQLMGVNAALRVVGEYSLQKFGTTHGNDDHHQREVARINLLHSNTMEQLKLKHAQRIEEIELEFEQRLDEVEREKGN